MGVLLVSFPSLLNRLRFVHFYCFPFVLLVRVHWKYYRSVHNLKDFSVLKIVCLIFRWFYCSYLCTPISTKWDIFAECNPFYWGYINIRKSTWHWDIQFKWMISRLRFWELAIVSNGHKVDYSVHSSYYSCHNPKYCFVIQSIIFEGFQLDKAINMNWSYTE